MTTYTTGEHVYVWDRKGDAEAAFIEFIYADGYVKVSVPRSNGIPEERMVTMREIEIVTPWERRIR
jgi:hypothetical protein